MSEVVVQRIVPGAPPPAPLSKAQKKKRKAKAKSAEPGDAPTPEATSAPPTEKTPEPPETQEAALAPEVIAPSDSQMSLLPEEEVFLKPSPIVDLIHKRVKATTKKIVFILVFSNTVWLIFSSLFSHGYLSTLLLTLKNLTTTRNEHSRLSLL